MLASSSRGRQYKLPMPNGVSAPQIVLASQPISTADIDMVGSAEPFKSFYLMIFNVPPRTWVIRGWGHISNSDPTQGFYVVFS